VHASSGTRRRSGAGGDVAWRRRRWPGPPPATGATSEREATTVRRSESAIGATPANAIRYSIIAAAT